MTNRRNFVKQLAATGIASSIPLSFLIPSLSTNGLSSTWLELVSPETIGMDSGILKEIDILVEQIIAIGHTPGAVVAIGRGNKMSFLKGYGYRQIYPEKEKITLDTLFDLASTTKVASTATAMAVVINQGKVSPDDLVIKYFPEFGNKGKEKITLRHLFTHTSGINEYSAQIRGTKEHLFDVLCSLDLLFPVGERYSYSDNNALMLGHIIEKVSGQNLSDFTLENIFEPLGMVDTMYNPDLEHIERTAATEMRDGKWYKGVVNDFNTFNLGGIGGDTGLFSTAPDLAILSALWLGKGMFFKKDGTKIELFNQETYEKIISSNYLNVGVRGLLWDKRSGWKNRPWNMTPAAIGHGGWTGTSIWIDPNLDLFVVVLGNRRHPFGETPNIYPTAARIGVVAVNSIIRKNETLSLYYSQDIKYSNRPRVSPITIESLKGKKIGLITNQVDIDNPNGKFAKLKNSGIDIVALYLSDESAEVISNNQYNQLVPISIRTDSQTGAPVYTLTNECLWILPKMIHESEIILFSLDIPDDCTENSFWFMISVLGHTLQSASDHQLKYALIDVANPLKRKFIAPNDLIDKLEPFGDYSRQARQFGLTFSDIAVKINEEQQLELEIDFLSID